MSCACLADHKIISDERALQLLFKIECDYLITENYLEKFEHKITSSMRTELSTWMLEVCEESECTDEVYGLAMNLFDRLMQAMDRVEVYHLQLLGSVCLFIGAKVKSSGELKLNATKLIEYADNAFLLEDLLEWELFVLDKLKWDVSSVVPNDFIDFFLHRIDDRKDVDLSALRRHAFAFTALCSSEFKFAQFKASKIAAAAILTGVEGLAKMTHQIAVELSEISNVEFNSLLELKNEISDFFHKSSGGVEICNEQVDKIDLDFIEFQPFFQSDDSYEVMSYSSSDKSIQTPDSRKVFNKLSTKRKSKVITPSPKKLNSRASSRSSSGVSSSGGANYLCQLSPSYFTLSPPNPRLLPMPTFKSDSMNCCNTFDHSAGCFDSLSKSAQKVRKLQSKRLSRRSKCSMDTNGNKQLIIF